MTKTGWIGDDPAAGPVLPVTDMLLGMRGEPDVLGTSMARAAAAEARERRAAAAAAADPDERAAKLVTRGYTPGLMHELSQRLADTTAELEEEREKIGKGERRAERAQREHQAGRVDAWQMQRMLDGDFGDAHRATQLEQRAESLRRQIAETAQMMAPRAQRAPDAVEEAATRAQRILAEVAAERRAEDEAEAAGRARMASERAAFYAARGERRPFASRGAAAEAGDWERERQLRAAVSGVSYR
jgi:hypothetical protein